jgi:Flp pilus assembly protein TadG
MIRTITAAVRGRQTGQALVLVALAIPVLLGFVGLSIDFGRLTVEQRKLQNYADAAALSGAQDLSKFYTQACTDANASLTANNNPAGVTCSVSQTNNPNDTITVRLSESVALDFLPILGLSSKTITASGVAITSSVTGCNDNVSGICAPYAGWRPSSTSGCPDQFQAGMTIVFRDNGWSDSTGAGNCADWAVNANDFKGFLRPTGSGSITVGNNTITTHGGNACGQEPAQDIQDAATNHQTIVIPVIDSGSGNGNTDVHIPGFITLSLNFTYPYVNQIQSVALNGPPTGGTFTLTYGGRTTSNLAYNASAADVQVALAALSSIGVGAGNVSVSGAAGGPYLITFGGSKTLSTLGLISATSSLSGGTSPAISVAQTETNASSAGQASQAADYNCPATWYGMVVSTTVSTGTVGGIDSGAACNSTYASCQIRLQP